MLRPSGTAMTISSARTVSLVASTWARGNCSRENSVPSALRMVNTPRSCSTGWPGVRRMPRILSASRLNDTGAPDFKSKTATPTGEVSISVSRPALALIDTGYTGSLIVPNILAFGSPDAQTSLHVGDGRTVRAPVYVGILEIKGFPPMYGIAVTLLGDEYIWAEDFLTSSRLPLTTARGLS